MTITENTIVAEIASALPSSVRVFQRHGIDFCCGGKIPLGLACQAHGISFAEVAGDIEASKARPAADERDWTRESLHALIEHIVNTFHEPLRAELPRLQAMAAKVARVHSFKEPRLSRLEAVLNELADDLQTHMQKEERVLFPAICRIESGGERPSLPISAPVAIMEQEHDRAGALLSELRTLAKGYVAPEWACETFRGLYHGLAELEGAMHLHVHLENNVLFPRALNLAGTPRTRTSQ